MTDWQGIWILAAFGLLMFLSGYNMGAALENRRIRRRFRKFFGLDEGKGDTK